MQREREKQPQGDGPLAEIEFWRARNAVLSSLFEQLNLPAVKKMVSVIELGSDDRNLMASYKSQVRHTEDSLINSFVLIPAFMLCSLDGRADQAVSRGEGQC